MRIRLRTGMLAVAAVAIGLASLGPSLRGYRTYRAETQIWASNPSAIAGLNSPAFLERVAAALEMAVLPELRAVADPVADLGRRLRFGMIPGTKLFVVSIEAPSSAAATAIVEAVAVVSAADGATWTVPKSTRVTRVRSDGDLISLAALALAGTVGLILVVKAAKLGRAAWLESRPAARRRTLEAVGAWDARGGRG